MLRTARERWPMTRLLVDADSSAGQPLSNAIRDVLARLASQCNALELDALVLARGGGSREDLAVFDDEDLCRDLAAFPCSGGDGSGP